MSGENPNLYARVRTAINDILRQWREVSGEPVLEKLHLFRERQRQALPARTYTVRQLVSEVLTTLESIDQRQADVLRLRYLEGFSVLQTTLKLTMAEQTVYLDQREGIDRLATLLCEQERVAQIQHQERIQQRLDVRTYSELVGVVAHLHQLQTLLTGNSTPWLILIEGIGGIGKTALVHQLVNKLIEQATYTDYAWVTARQEHLDLGGGMRTLERPALTTEALVDGLVRQLGEDDPSLMSLTAAQKLNWLENTCKRNAILIVIDNLETLLDVETLIPVLGRLIDPTRIILTSRIRLESEPGIYHFSVPALDEVHSLQLIRLEAKNANLQHVADASDDELRPIYETVGGNPLALRLLVGQLHTQNLDLVLEDLRNARGATVEALYTYIYRRSWQRLNQIERDVWLCLPLLLGPSATAQALAQISQHSLDVVRDALDRLARFNLIDCHGTLNQRFYTIHSLTRTFLQKQVAQWT